MGVNKFLGIGNLGKEPEVREINNKKVANFSIGISETWRDKNGEKQQSTEWVNCVVWGALAGVVEKYLKKGSKVYIEGKLKTDSYEKDGQTRYVTKVNVMNLEMLGVKPENHHQSAQKEPAKVGNENTSFEETDDLPF